LPITDGLKNKY